MNERVDEFERLNSYFGTRIIEDPTTGCWVGQWKPLHHGYMRVRVNQKPHAAHRWVYELMVAEIPEGLELDHLCRNTSCVNPEHLEPVSRAENMRRTRWETCLRGHALTDDNVYWHKRGGRTCRTCTIQRSRARHAKRKLQAAS